MTPKEMWLLYKKDHSHIGNNIEAWQFGEEPDKLAQLVLKGIKTATSSAYDLYEGEPLPQVGSYDILMDSQQRGYVY